MFYIPFFPSLEKLVKASSCLYSSSLADVESKCQCLRGGWGAGVLGDEGLRELCRGWGRPCTWPQGRLSLGGYFLAVDY